MTRRFLPLIVFLIIAGSAITAGYFIISKDKPLPILQPSDVNPELVPEDMQGTIRGHRLSPFTLTSHKGEEISLEDLNGKILLSDFFFVTCPSICPKMTKEMKTIWEEYGNHPDVVFLSFTVMPEHDSPEVLNHYADSVGVNNSNWIFITGPKEEIYRLARRSFMVTKSEGDGGEHDFIHTENFVLSDPQKRIRAYYDGTDPDHTKRAIRDIKNLLGEKDEK